MEEVARYIPSVERARQEGLEAERQVGFLPMSSDWLSGEPSTEMPLCAVIVDARVQRRDSVEQQVQIPLATADRMATAPPEPPAFPEQARSRYLIERHHSPTDCAGCELERGKQDCKVCATRGHILVESGDNTVRRRCTGCDGEGWMACSTCGGIGHALWVRLMQVDDQVYSLRYAYVPTMTTPLELRVGALFDELPATLPACLRFDPSPRGRGSAYRGETAPRELTFQGHGFGDALDRARSAIASLRAGGTVLHEEVKTYAWPLLWLGYRSLGRKGDVALLVSPHTLEQVAIVADD